LRELTVVIAVLSIGTKMFAIRAVKSSSKGKRGINEENVD
jgi:hypothetical protein